MLDLERSGPSACGLGKSGRLWERFEASRSLLILPKRTLLSSRGFGNAAGRFGAVWTCGPFFRRFPIFWLFSGLSG